MKAFHFFDNFNSSVPEWFFPSIGDPTLPPPPSLSYSEHSGNYCLYYIISRVIVFPFVFHLYLLFTFCIAISASSYNFYNLVLLMQLLFSERLFISLFCILSPLPKISKNDLTIMTYNECVLPFNHECNLLFNTSHLACDSSLFSAIWISSNFSALNGIWFR